MITTTRSNLIKNLTPLLAEHGKSGAPLLVLSTQKQANPMIVISQAKYNELMEKSK